MKLIGKNVLLHVNMNHVEFGLGKYLDAYGRLRNEHALLEGLRVVVNTHLLHVYRQKQQQIISIL